MSDWRIPLSHLDYGPEEEVAVRRVIKSGWLSMGPEVESFEREFAQFLGVQFAIAVSSGTAALHLAYLALGLGPGDELVQSPINFVAAANLTVAIGATPVFADIISLNEPTIDPAEIERRLTPQTKAVLVMHYGGYPCRMSEISAICKDHRLALIEDACHAVGARYAGMPQEVSNGKMAGTIGDIGCFSFFSNKNLAIGEGGMVVTNRADLAERVRKLRSHGMTSLTWDRHRDHTTSYDVTTNGYNYRLDEIRGALGRVQLQKLERNNAWRKKLVETYRYKLSSLEGWTITFNEYEGDTACHLMVVVAPTEAERTAAVSHLKEMRIQTSMHYPFIPSFSAFRDSGTFDAKGLTRSISFAQRAMTLPLSSGMTVAQTVEVGGALLQAPPA